MWQSLFDELKDLGFTVVAVALDEADAARPWVEAAQPAYPCLIDREHRVADLYRLVNVPQATWIDEQGRIVRGPETAGSTDAFRAMDRRTFALPQAALDERDRVKRAYFDAVRDWARHGAASRFVPAGGAALPDTGDAQSEAHARFRLGRHLQQGGLADEARAQLAQAAQLHPDSWAMWRQAADKNERGLAAGPAFWARVDALGDRPYYPLPDIVAPGR
ncbi:MAG: hypothetical protein RJA10_3555 [Pseudomonadota bacterium]